MGLKMKKTLMFLESTQKSDFRIFREGGHEKPKWGGGGTFTVFIFSGGPSGGLGKKEGVVFLMGEELISQCMYTMIWIFRLRVLKTNSCLDIVSVSIVFVVGNVMLVKICHNVNKK